MAGACVVHRDEGRTLEPGLQHLLILLDEGLEVSGEESHHLPLRDLHANPVEDCRQPFRGHLPLGMQHKAEAPQVGAIPAHDPGRHGSHDRLARRGHPALAPVTQDLGGERQVAHQECLVALKPRALRRPRSDDHVAGHAITVALGAPGLAPTLVALGPQGVGCGLHT